MTTVSVVIPTIRGREDVYGLTVEAFRATAPAGALELITVRDRPVLGAAWTDGAAAATGDYVMLAADDVLPQDGWMDAAIQAADDGVYPSPRITNPDGRLHSCGTMGGGMLLPECATGTPCGSSPFPFLRREVWTQVGPALPIHYYGDDYLAARARMVGLSVEVVRGYHLVHLEGTVGRQPHIERSRRDCQAYLAAFADASFRVAA